MIQKDFNAISTGFTGKFSNQVCIRKRYGKLEITKVPVRRPGPGTDGQQAERQRWTNANAWYRKAVKGDAGRCALYKSGIPLGWNVQNRAVSDYYHAPVISGVNTGAYAGNRGDILRITATDDFMVHRVTVSIYNTEGVLVESGMATPGQGDEWLYRTRRNNKEGGRVEVVAADMPGNEDRVLLNIQADVALVCEPVAAATPVNRPKKAFIWKRERKQLALEDGSIVSKEKGAISCIRSEDCSRLIHSKRN